MHITCTLYPKLAIHFDNAMRASWRSDFLVIDYSHDRFAHVHVKCIAYVDPHTDSVSDSMISEYTTTSGVAWLSIQD